MSHDEDDITISPAQRAYLAAFDHWLKTSWATGRVGNQHDGATEVKAACFDAMLHESGVIVPEYREGHRARKVKVPIGPVCALCGASFVVQRQRGRPRVKCYACSPARFTARLVVEAELPRAA